MGIPSFLLFQSVCTPESATRTYNGFVPYDIRPLVSVKVLPALEDILYGADLSNIISEYTNPILDVVAWFPYGIGHFGLPAICSALLFLFAAPGTTPYFARSFGWMSILGVAMQIVFPCTPPWYEKLHGLEPAIYGMQGSPAGLARIDDLFGVDLYTTSFTTAPVPFGAFPSLHAADAALHALFISHCFPRLRGFCAFYVAWLCWATMYLNHHYAIDLVGGIAIAVTVFFTVKARWLPLQQPDKANRWEYTFVDGGPMRKGVDVESGLQRRDSDAWSAHSASSGSTLCGSPSTPDENQWTRETAFSKRSS
ncbi:putative pap2 superfamily protein [Eutypa lata UCREL1]|uniref:Putative pap2 superfamily protein n=1 Tax=Eutypa lata (strain UCR-EL1) TaxID=1287681 RepID=M7T7Y5_EUTLA|nr:putative pap2 superfamily protein [Eutypa lata UCREL1]